MISSIHWRSVSPAPSYKHKNEHCNLCLAEKYPILMADPKTTLNKTIKLLNNYRHCKLSQIEESKTTATWIAFKPYSYLCPFCPAYSTTLTSFTMLSIYIQLHLISILSVSFFQHIVWYVNFIQFLIFSQFLDTLDDLSHLTEKQIIGFH